MEEVLCHVMWEKRGEEDDVDMTYRTLKSSLKFSEAVTTSRGVISLCDSCSVGTTLIAIGRQITGPPKGS